MARDQSRIAMQAGAKTRTQRRATEENLTQRRQDAKVLD
jgi:hypothetical protein